MALGPSKALHGAKEAAQKLREFASKFPDRVLGALYTEAQIEATEMKRRCPVDVDRTNGRVPPHPGNLRNSIHVEEPVRKGKSISVTIATGAQAPYAIPVHENLDALHEVGEAKFMESVLNESRDHIGSRIAARLSLG